MRRAGRPLPPAAGRVRAGLLPLAAALLRLRRWAVAEQAGDGERRRPRERKASAEQRRRDDFRNALPHRPQAYAAPRRKSMATRFPIVAAAPRRSSPLLRSAPP